MSPSIHILRLSAFISFGVILTGILILWIVLLLAVYVHCKVNCYKLAQNKSFDECLIGSANAILSLSVDPNGGTAVQFLTKLKQQLLYWKPLLRKLTQGEPANEVAWVKAVEAYALRESAVESQFARVLKLAFDLDVLSDVVRVEFFPLEYK